MRIEGSGNRLFVLLLSGMAVAAMTISFLRVNWETVSTFVDQQRRLAAVKRESSHPIVAELADRRIRPGDPIADLIARHPPTQALAHDRYTTICYVEGNRETYLIARDGQLVYARQCGSGVPAWTFFSAWSRADERDWAASRDRAIANAR